MRKFLLVLLFVLTFLFLLPKQSSLATSDSPSDYNVTYTINKNASTHVNIDVTLTNNEENSFFSSYSIQLGYSELKNLKASDGIGVITPTVNKNQKGSTISLKFNEKVIGEGEKLNFNLNFDTDEIAENRGNVWEINIPGIADKNDFNLFNVTVVYPTGIGKPVYIKPNIAGALANRTGNTLKFSKDDLKTAGISIAFGDFQIYKFNLSYHLKNSNLFPIRTEIAIPPQTNYQDIILTNINPKPNNITIDNDGNWMAEYTLKPSQTKNIKVTGKAKVNLTPKGESITAEQKKEYLSKKPYWEIDDSRIKQLAEELQSPYAIYQFVVNNLTYDFGRITLSKSRIGAKNAIDNPKSAVCLEFTDLFIALSRAAGIPAREINGFAYAKKGEERPLSLYKDILHAWPEYYDSTKKTWVMVDPTWGNTTGGVDYFFTLDVDHLAFVKKGENSSYPIPAGGYKLSEDSKQKDVEVALDSRFEKNEDFQIINNYSNYLSSLSPIKGVIKIENKGNVAISDKNLLISTNKLTPGTQKIAIDTIPPFAYIEVPVVFDSVSPLTNLEDQIKIQFQEKEDLINVKIAPYYIDSKIILGGIIIVTSIIIISLAIYMSRRILISRSKREDPLRGQSQKP